jgi:hypothetical protein
MKAIRNIIEILIVLTLLIPWATILILTINMKIDPMIFGLAMGTEMVFPCLIGLYLSNKFGKWFDSKLKQDEKES